MHAIDTQALVAAHSYDVVDARVTQYSNVALLLSLGLLMRLCFKCF